MSYLLVVASILVTYVASNCMFCKTMDTRAGFLYSYSYCKESDTCVSDQWDKINAWCDSPWKRGYTLDLETDCDAKIVEPCLEYNSASIMESQNFTNTQVLGPNEICIVYLDATSFVAHARFWATSSTNDDAEVGILYNGVMPGEYIEVAKGSALSLSIYNSA